MKKLVSLAMIGVLSLSTVLASGCGNRGGNVEIDKSKTQLFVGMQEGGQGREWLDALALEFEELHKDDELEPGKKGVQVYVTVNKNFNGSQMAQLNSMREEIMFTENSFEYNNLINSNVLLDITDVVTGSMSKYGEDNTIEEKMNESYRDWFNVNGKYYGVPWYTSSFHINYDIDMFEDNLFYFSASDTNGVGHNRTFIRSLNEKKSNGPDGKEGTYDDGLPATFEEFYTLCNRIAGRSIVPMVWTGKLTSYFSDFLTAFYADIEGVDGLDAHFRFKGTADDLIESFDGKGNPVYQDPIEINMANGYETFRQKGFYYALSFLENVKKKEGSWFNYNDCFGTSLGHTGAQERYLFSSPDERIDDIAMLFEGNWWYAESSGARADLVEEFGEEQANRRFGIMPFPKATAEEVGQPYTVYQTSASVGVIKSNIAKHKVELAKDFIRFTSSNGALATFTEKSSMMRPFDYTLSDGQISKMSTYGQQQYIVAKNSNAYLPISQNPIIRSELGLTYNSLFWNSKTTVGTYQAPSAAFDTDNFPDKINARVYFEGLSNNFSKEYWDRNYGKFYNA